MGKENRKKGKKRGPLIPLLKNKPDQPQQIPQGHSDNIGNKKTSIAVVAWFKRLAIAVGSWQRRSASLSTELNSLPVKKLSSNLSKHHIKKKRLDRLTILFILLFILFGCIAYFLPSYIAKSAPTKVKGEYTQLGNVAFSYNTKQHTSYSPMCGCMREFEDDKWRGVSFAAKDIRIQRTGSSPITGYFITGAFPQTISEEPSIFEFSATLYSIALPFDEEFRPDLLLSDHLPPSYEVSNNKRIGPELFLLFITRDELHVSLLGDKPLGAWIPVKDSKVTLGFEKLRRAVKREFAYIEESYKEDPIETNESHTGSHRHEYPLGDFLGPNVVLWTEDPSASIINKNSIVQVSKKEDTVTKKKISAILIRQPPFSTRIACQAFAEEPFQRYMSEINKEANKKAFMLSPPRGEGKVTLLIENIEEQSDLYDKAFRSLSENDIVSVEGMLGRLNDGNSIKEMSFRYPPVPENYGFNIWGSVSQLSLSDAIGKMWFGSRLVDIPTSATLEFRNLNSAHFEGGTITVPIYIKKTNGLSLLKLKDGVSEVFLNETPISIMATEYTRWIEYVPRISALMSALGAIATIINAINALRNRPKP